VDCFGNCKTTLLSVDDHLNTRLAELPRYAYLKDVPDGESGVIVGSSGHGQNRFLEIVTQGGDASKSLNLEVGSLL
jgi:hypothetical protein